MGLTRRAAELFERLPGVPHPVFITASKKEQHRHILSKILSGTMGLEIDLSQELENLEATQPILSYLAERGITGEHSRLIGAVDAVVPYHIAKELSSMGYDVGLPAPKTTKTASEQSH